MHGFHQRSDYARIAARAIVLRLPRGVLFYSLLTMARSLLQVRPPLLVLGIFCTITRAVSQDEPTAFPGVIASAKNINSAVVDWRRALHEMPELMYQEYNTSLFIQKALKDMGIQFTTGWAKNTRQDRIPGLGGTGIVATIGTGQPPIVALRSDIDALPIHEETDVPFRSKAEGRMHACGHDTHAAMLLGAAKLLKDQKLPGTVRLIWQPAEEGGAGAKRMREEGVLEGVSRIFGLHIWPGLPSGTYASRPGVLMAAADMFEITIAGKGGHGAMPHLAVDPIPAVAAIVSSLQSIVSRETSPLGAAVVSVTKIQAGDALNVVPGTAVIGGTVRSLDLDGLQTLRERLEEVATNVAKAHRCTIAEAKYMPDPFDATVNDPALIEWLASSEMGLNSTGMTSVNFGVEPTMGGEDFAFFSQQVPAAFVFLGQGTGTGSTASAEFPTSTTVHNPRFNADEDVLHLGTALHTHFAVRSLHALKSSVRAEL
eukprot:TRINITY_DN83330_c0_g1_i1.p1 TRINITY_DN83330_c0_g1~~TRINITY_DN83330_c0_g1_i1.p1  ORF type:complete len:485 (+),score=50.36 TRINITY_DN83330_c0_g1_i1:57-1511(+)